MAPRNQAAALQRRWMDGVEKSFDGLNHKIDDREEKFDRQLEGLEKVLAAVSSAMRDLANAVEAQKPIAVGHQELRTTVAMQGLEITTIRNTVADLQKGADDYKARLNQGRGFITAMGWMRVIGGTILAAIVFAFGYLARIKQDGP